MNKLIDRIKELARQDPKRIVFLEPNDERVAQAIEVIKRENIAIPLVLTQDNIEAEKQRDFAHTFYERRKAKGVTLEEAQRLMENPLYYGAMLVREGYAEGFVAGAVFTTSSVIRAALNCLEIDKSIGLVSSCFIIVVPNCDYGEEGVFVYSDCGVVPYPTPEQLALIAISAAKFTKEVLGFGARVALLSFSTKGSAGSRAIERIKEALRIAKLRVPELIIDGELQADAAIVPEVAKVKAPQSKVAGNANVLIFPNLDAGNICYKLTQRLAKARAIGPIILGTVQPCSDLSRGCSRDDIVDCTAITVIRAQKVSS
jgi:phosphate acetyltransferase